MKKVLMSALCVILAVMFIVTLYCYGDGKRFSLKKWFSNVSMAFSALGAIGDVSKYWVYDFFTVDGVDIYPEEMPDTAVDWLVGGILEFFGVVKGFFVRCFYTVRHVLLVVYVVHTVAGRCLPWNCLVEVTS